MSEGNEIEQIHPDEENCQFLSYDEIYKELLTNDEIILVIDRNESQRLRRRLTVLKAKDIARMKDAGLEADDSKLEFIVIEDKEIPKDRIKIQIVLKTKVKIKVYTLQILDGSLT